MTTTPFTPASHLALLAQRRARAKEEQQRSVLAAAEIRMIERQATANLRRAVITAIADGMSEKEAAKHSKVAISTIRVWLGKDHWR
jgi:hypothetical protein